MFVRGKVKTCNFTTVSDCGKRNVTSYMEEAMKGGNACRSGGDNIKREVLSTEHILSRASNWI